jgi:hypothetical protein
MGFSLRIKLPTREYKDFPPSLSGLPQHATLGPAAAYYASPVDGSGGPHSPTKYHENGHDTFSDFVTLVCQEAQSTTGSQGGGQVL